MIGKDAKLHWIKRIVLERSSSGTLRIHLKSSVLLSGREGEKKKIKGELIKKRKNKTKIIVQKTARKRTFG